MKKLLLILSVMCVTVAVAAEASLDYFTAKSDGRSITVQWRSAVENNVRSYEIERSNDGKTFRYLKAITATGSNSEYRFSDEEVFMKGDGENTLSSSYSYRLRIIGKDNTVTYSNQTNVSHAVSGVRRTWGMIKEMFR
ncbi:MAG TPA: hypothetical protein PLI74_01830 [Candidatus Kapabacteria bacterium]|jgi:hypothetical protein|nr:hypothetical protein [Ignavibacteria bacterium]HRI31471.1 hypothetical protein [Candidatus Kapabacteria bacterium]HRK58354.1 hypothetical protein [Candidatus Kapabacteria bacterium]